MACVCGAAPGCDDVEKRERDCAPFHTTRDGESENERGEKINKILGHVRYIMGYMRGTSRTRASSHTMLERYSFGRVYIQPLSRNCNSFVVVLYRPKSRKSTLPQKLWHFNSAGARTGGTFGGTRGHTRVFFLMRWTDNIRNTISFVCALVHLIVFGIFLVYQYCFCTI